MTLLKIIKIANKAYPDGLILQAYKQMEYDLGMGPDTGKVGDGLAEFIVREITETYDPKAGTRAQLREAHRVIETATRELESIGRAIWEARCKLAGGEL
jgi:hypothetical protein